MDTPIDIHTATRDQLIEYGREELGLAIPKNANKDVARDAVAVALGVSVQTDLKQDDKVPVMTRNEAELNKQERVRLRILEGPDLPPRVQIGVNGVMYTIVPGAVVEVPKSVVGVLRNAYRTDYRQEVVEGVPKMSERNSLAYPFEIIS